MTVTINHAVEAIKTAETVKTVKTVRIRTLDELYIALEGKTDRKEIMAILNGATLNMLKEYLRYEGGYKAYACISKWKKADYVRNVTDLILENIAVEEECAKVLANMGTNDTQKFTTLTELNFIGLGETDGKPCIYLYVNRKKNIPRPDILDNWDGIPVKVQYIGKIKPA